jgi:hypothetical protein
MPEVYPAKVAEDICPVTINYGDYFMSGSIWHKFNSKFPNVPFDVFMSCKIEKYEKKSLDAKNVFKHTCNRLCHDGTHRHRICGSNHLLLCLPTKMLLCLRAPFFFPKIEVIDLTEYAEYEYMYKRPLISAVMHLSLTCILLCL